MALCTINIAPTPTATTSLRNDLERNMGDSLTQVPSDPGRTHSRPIQTRSILERNRAGQLDGGSNGTAVPLRYRRRRKLRLRYAAYTGLVPVLPPQSRLVHTRPSAATEIGRAHV